MTDYTDMAKRCWENSRDHGFWDEPRDFEEMMALADSELVEALEEHRHGRELEYKEEHTSACDVSMWWAAWGEITWDGDGWWKDYGLHRIPVDPAECPPCSSAACKPEGIAVELADFIIRVFETSYGLGFRGHNDQMGSDPDWLMSPNFAANVFRIGKHLHDAAEAWARDQQGLAFAWLMMACRRVLTLAEAIGCDDFEGVIGRKMKFNATRPFKHQKAY